MQKFPRTKRIGPIDLNTRLKLEMFEFKVTKEPLHLFCNFVETTIFSPHQCTWVPSMVSAFKCAYISFPSFKTILIFVPEFSTSVHVGYFLLWELPVVHFDLIHKGTGIIYLRHTYSSSNNHLPISTGSGSATKWTSAFVGSNFTTILIGCDTLLNSMVYQNSM